MANSHFDPFPNPSFVETQWPENPDLEQVIAALKQSQSMNYQMMRLNAWVLSETMDQFLPGFWNRFMTNRQIAHRQFLERQKQKK
jgi:hypothetical protein